MKKLTFLIILAIIAISYAAEKSENIVLTPVAGGTLSKEKFTPNSYALSYSGKQANNAILLKFDFTNLPAANYQNLKLATLKISAPPKKSKIRAYWIKDNWEPLENLTWNSDNWDNKSYKIPRYASPPAVSYRAKKPALTFSLAKIDKQSIVFSNGAYSLDLTDSMREKIYSGRQEYGLALLLEQPDNIQLEVPPTLELEFTGIPPANDSASITARALKLFPSATLAPVKDPHIFLLCVYSRDFQDILWNELNTFNTDGVYSRPEYEQNGILCLRASWMPNEVKTKQRKTHEQFMRDFSSSTSGVAIDEWQVKNTSKRGDPLAKLIGSDSTVTVDGAITAIREFKKIKPEAMVGVYWRGEDSLQPLAADNLPDLVIPEVYTSFTKAEQRKWEIGKIEDAQHLAWAKEDGYYDKVIPLHGCVFASSVFPENDKPWTRERLEHDIKFFKDKHPTLIGQGFYCSTGEKTKENIEALVPVLKWADEILHDVYIKPAPVVTVIQPVFEAKFSQALPHVTIQADAVAKDERKIIQYQWFIDNRLIAETAENKYLWDIRGEQPGRHIITVHAVDEKYYRGASQIPVTIQP